MTFHALFLKVSLILVLGSSGSQSTKWDRHHLCPPVVQVQGLAVVGHQPGEIYIPLVPFVNM
jgi:hypothetical protein